MGLCGGVSDGCDGTCDDDCPTCTPDCASDGQCGGASDGCGGTCDEDCPGVCWEADFIRSMKLRPRQYTGSELMNDLHKPQHLLDWTRGACRPLEGDFLIEKPVIFARDSWISILLWGPPEQADFK